MLLSRAVLSADLPLSTACGELFEQYSFHLFTFYCSDASVRAVVIKNSLVSTAPDYCPEQFYRRICNFLLLVETKSSSTTPTFSTFYCSDAPIRAVVITNSPVTTAPNYSLEQFYQRICDFLLLVENKLSSTTSTFSLSTAPTPLFEQ